MKLVKAVQFRIAPDPRLIDLLSTFRDMVNDAIRIGLQARPTSLYQFRNLVYHDFKARYGLHCHYAYNVCEVAYNILRKHWKWKRAPEARHLMLKLDAESYWVNHILLRVPTKPGEYLFIQLYGGQFQLSLLDDPTLKRGSMLLTPDKAVITVTKQAEPTTSEGAVAYDINLRNVTGISSKSPEPITYDTSELPRIRAQYRKVTSNFRRADFRIARRVRSKYGTKERQKVGAILHKISKDIVSHAKEKKLAIVLENLKYVRNKHTKKSFESRRARERLNKWSYKALQNMIVYKAAWSGVPTVKVNPANSSRRCCVCRVINHGLSKERVWQCPNCGATLDRDVNASVNLLTTSLTGHEALRFGADWLADEAMRRRVATTSPEESMPASRQQADGIVA